MRWAYSIRASAGASNGRIPARLRGLLLTHRSRLDLATIKRLRAEIRLRKIDAIHSHGYKPDFYGGLAARIAGIPVISTAIFGPGTRLKSYALVDAVLCADSIRLLLSPSQFLKN